MVNLKDIISSSLRSYYVGIISIIVLAIGVVAKDAIIKRFKIFSRSLSLVKVSNFHEAIEKNNYIIGQLHELKANTGSNRAYLYQFHNGEILASNLHLWKMTCTNEVKQDYLRDTKDQHRGLLVSMYAISIKELTFNKILNIPDVLSYKDQMFSNLLQDNGSVSTYIRCIFNNDGQPLGFIGIDFLDRYELDKDGDDLLKSKSDRIQYKLCNWVK